MRAPHPTDTSSGSPSATCASSWAAWAAGARAIAAAPTAVPRAAFSTALVTFAWFEPLCACDLVVVLSAPLEAREVGSAGLAAHLTEVIAFTISSLRLSCALRLVAPAFCRALSGYVDRGH